MAKRKISLVYKDGGIIKQGEGEAQISEQMIEISLDEYKITYDYKTLKLHSSAYSLSLNENADSEFFVHTEYGDIPAKVFCKEIRLKREGEGARIITAYDLEMLGIKQEMQMELIVE